LNSASYLTQSPEHADCIQVDSLLPKAVFLILAGTETTATALSGLIYYLLANPRTLYQAEHEVRQAFQEGSRHKHRSYM
jgi:cytochrome P450